MSIRQIERLPDEPIIIVTYEGPLYTDDIAETYRRCDMLAVPGLTLLILDARAVTDGDDPVLRILTTEIARVGLPMRAVTFFVGDDGRAGAHAADRALEAGVTFPTVEDALAAARAWARTHSATPTAEDAPMDETDADTEAVLETADDELDTMTDGPTRGMADRPAFSMAHEPAESAPPPPPRATPSPDPKLPGPASRPGKPSAGTRPPASQPNPTDKATQPNPSTTKNP
jgi:hypothetical protein